MWRNTCISLGLALGLGMAASAQTQINLANQVKGNLLIGNNTRCAADTVIHGLGTGTNPECLALPNGTVSYSTSTHQFTVAAYPRLDQVLDPTANKTFNVAGYLLNYQADYGNYYYANNYGTVDGTNKDFFIGLSFGAYNASATPTTKIAFSEGVGGYYSDAGAMTDYTWGLWDDPVGGYVFNIAGGTSDAYLAGNYCTYSGGGYYGCFDHAITAHSTWTLPNLTGYIPAYAGTPINLTAQSSATSATTILATGIAPGAGRYLLAAEVYITTASGTATVTPNIISTAGGVARTMPATAAASCASTSNYAIVSQVVYADASTNLQASTTVSGTVGSCRWAVRGSVTYQGP